jgi:hypothetical protein
MAAGINPDKKFYVPKVAGIRCGEKEFLGSLYHKVPGGKISLAYETTFEI